MWVLEIQTQGFYLLTLISVALLILLLVPHSQTWPWCANVTWGSPGPIFQGPGLLEKNPFRQTHTSDTTDPPISTAR